jgi:hypothetical protein
MSSWDKDGPRIRHEILAVREACNETNPLRTDYYERFWAANREIPWTLLANLVSRNAGYQMSDLARFSARLAMHGALAVVVAPRVTIQLGLAQIKALWAYLELGNFLIFRDVSPALEGWARAKRQPEHTERIFDMLLEPEFGLDPFVVEQWKGFARLGDARTQAQIQRHTFALITNEQNQIEDRLVRGVSSYLGALAPTTSALVRLYGALGLTRLGFPLGSPSAGPKAEQLAIYDVSDFTSLDARINTGRDVFVGLLETPERRDRVNAWVSANRVHSGSRTDYNEPYYSTHRISLIDRPLPIPGLIDETYSPPLKPWQGEKAAWYDPLPRCAIASRSLYRAPVPLPVPVSARAQAAIDQWLAPLAAPARPITEHDLDDLVEIRDEDEWFV